MLTQETKEALEVILSNRRFLYLLFHKVFGREPDQAFLKILSSEETSQAFGLLSEQPEDTMERAAAFVCNLKEKSQDTDYLHQIRYEYMRLFVGPEKLAAPPWESVYRSKQGLLFQESTLTIREIYRKQGLLPEGYPHVADDSLALELDFMARMADRSCLALGECRYDDLRESLAVQESFLRVHMLFWIPKLLEKMTDSVFKLFYPQMTKILLAFLEKDQELIKEIPDMIIS